YSGIQRIESTIPVHFRRRAAWRTDPSDGPVHGRGQHVHLPFYGSLRCFTDRVEDLFTQPKVRRARTDESGCKEKAAEVHYLPQGRTPLFQTKKHKTVNLKIMIQATKNTKLPIVEIVPGVRFYADAVNQLLIDTENSTNTISPLEMLPLEDHYECVFDLHTRNIKKDNWRET